MSIEAMKQALEALNSYHGYMEPLTTVFGGPRVPAEQSTTGKVEKAITALRTAIKQAEKQEPVAWMQWLNGPCRLFMNKDDAMLELDRLNREYPADSPARKMRPLVFGDTTPPAAQPAPVQEPPPECQTEAEKRAYAFGWWKAMDYVRQNGIIGETK